MRVMLLAFIAVFALAIGANKFMQTQPFSTAERTASTDVRLD